MTGAAAGPSGWLTRWAELTPQAPALAVQGRSVWTYAELLTSVNRGARALRARGVGPGEAVCCAVTDPVVARLVRWSAAVAGAVDAQVDPALPRPEIGARAALVRARRVFTDADVPELRRALLDGPGSVDDGRATPDRELIPGLAVVARPETPARVLFTTGSTGVARAVLHLAGQLDSAARSNAAARGIVGSDVLLSVLPLYHAAGSLFEDTVLSVGGCVELPGDRGTEALAAALRSSAATVATVVPALLSRLADLDDGAGLTALGGLRLLNYAGEPIRPELLARLLAGFGGLVTRGYGLTEAGPLVSVLGDRAHRGPVLPDPGDIGHPAPGVEVRLARNGELLVRSGHVMAGYLGTGGPHPDRGPIDAEGWLRTGDLAVRHTGGLRLTGRLGHRIRSGGEWVSLDQVERCLAGVAGVLDAAVVAVPHIRWGERPVAYIRAAASLDPALVRDELAASLPRVSLPDWIEVLDEFPLTGHGKLDRAALRARAVGRGVAAGTSAS